jgi:hypothetical protein
MRRIFLAILVLATTLFTAIPAYANQAVSLGKQNPAVISSEPNPAIDSGPWLICEAPGYNWCWRDPSLGDNGTLIKEGEYNGDNSYDWKITQDLDRCGGVVSSSCPDTSASFWRQFDGKEIVVVKQYVEGHCVRVTTGDLVEMGNCDTGPSGNNEVSTAFVFDVLCGGQCNAYIPIVYSNVVNGPQAIYGLYAATYPVTR